MAEIEQTAPTFVVMGKTEAVASEDKVTVYFGTDDKKRFKLGIAAGLIPTLILELRARLMQLRPEGSETAVAPLVPLGMQLAMASDGTPALIIAMDGYEMALNINRDALKVLHDDMGQMLNPS